MVVNVHVLYLFSHCVSFALLIIDFIVILHVRLIRVLLKINHNNVSPILITIFRVLAGCTLDLVFPFVPNLSTHVRTYHIIVVAIPTRCPQMSHLPSCLLSSASIVIVT